MSHAASRVVLFGLAATVALATPALAIPPFTEQWLLPASPQDVEVDPSGRVWVSCVDDSIRVYTPSGGALLLTFGGTGAGDGQFQDPYGMAFDPSGEVYICDYAGARVEKFTSEGGYLLQWPIPSDRSDHACVDAAGDVYVTGYTDRIRPQVRRGRQSPRRVAERRRFDDGGDRRGGGHHQRGAVGRSHGRTVHDRRDLPGLLHHGSPRLHRHRTRRRQPAPGRGLRPQPDPDLHDRRRAPGRLRFLRFGPRGVQRRDRPRRRPRRLDLRRRRGQRPHPALRRRDHGDRRRTTAGPASWPSARSRPIPATRPSPSPTSSRATSRWTSPSWTSGEGSSPGSRRGRRPPACTA